MKQEKNIIQEDKVNANISAIWDKVIEKYIEFRIHNPFTTEEKEKYNVFYKCHNVIKENSDNINWAKVIKILQGKHFYEKTWDTSFGKVLDIFLTSKKGNYALMLNALVDETISFSNRFANYKEYVKNNFGSNGDAKTERTVSIFLTCSNPYAYAPFMSEVYNNMCNCFYGIGNGIEKEGKRYPHYLKMLQLLVDKICKNDNLHSIVSKNIQNEIFSDLLLAQDIAWGFRKTDNIDNLFMEDLNVGKKEMSTSSFVKDFKTFLLNNHNMIFTGAPGTGKTYLAKQIAASIIGCSVKELRGNKHFGFVQFHPSYDYTDFVEGLRPSEEEGKEFELRQGIFKQFCATALEKNNSFDEAYAHLVEDIQALDRPMTVVTPKAAKFGITINSNGNLNLHTGEKMQKNGVLTTDALKAMANNQPTYPYWQGYYKGVVELLKQKYGLQVSDAEDKSNYVFVIDEINRGEISKIFGELFYSIDPAYRGEVGSVKTQYQNMVKDGPFTDGFYVPKNIYIIGTMNDIDRSVESLDFAFRRRFPSIEITYDQTLDSISEQLENKSIIEEAKERLKKLNVAIQEDDSLGTEYCIGGSYLLKLNEIQNSFKKLWDYYILPVVAEYFRGMPSTEKVDKLNSLKNAFLG